MKLYKRLLRDTKGYYLFSRYFLFEYMYLTLTPRFVISYYIASISYLLDS